MIEVLKFYSDPLLRKVDIELFKTYAFKDQFTVSAEESMDIFSLEKEELTYGEAIWSSIDQILKFINPDKDMVFYDLGCGTGRVCFFANIKYHLKAYGIDLLPTFINNAEKIKNKFSLEDVHFIKNNWLNFDFSNADIIYVAGTCLNDETLSELTNKLKSIKKNTYVISVSNELKSEDLSLVKRMYLPFSWGRANVFISIKN